MDFTWTIKSIGSIETVGSNWLQKRTFVLEEVSDKEYKGSIAVDLIKDKVNMINEYKVGDVVKVEINVRANYSDNTKRYYNSLNAWKIEWVATAKVESVDDDELF